MTLISKWEALAAEVHILSDTYFKLKVSATAENVLTMDARM